MAICNHCNEDREVCTQVKDWHGNIVLTWCSPCTRLRAWESYQEQERDEEDNIKENEINEAWEQREREKLQEEAIR